MRVDLQVLKKATIVRKHGGPWNAHSHHVLAMLGVKKPPAGGLAARQIEGVTVWVDSLAVARGNQRFHRVRCACPHCGEEMSLGRLPQHVMVHAEQLL